MGRGRSSEEDEREETTGDGEGPEKRHVGDCHGCKQPAGALVPEQTLEPLELVQDPLADRLVLGAGEKLLLSCRSALGLALRGVERSEILDRQLGDWRLVERSDVVDDRDRLLVTALGEQEPEPEARRSGRARSADASERKRDPDG